MRTSPLAALTALALFSSLMACERPSERALAEPVEPPKKASPTYDAALAGAQHWVARAKHRAFPKAINQARSKLERMELEAAPTMPAGLLEQGKQVTLMFSSNNHGEREDCGCKRNPLGGLSRRATLIELVESSKRGAALDKGRSEQLATYWGIASDATSADPLERSGALFVADAGDLLFPHATLESSPEPNQTKHLEQARAVIAALNASHPPDAFNVGELDLSLGLDALRELEREASFPFLSANLTLKEDGSHPFAGHVVVERDNAKVAYVGLLKPRARVKDYYMRQGIVVEEPAVAYARELAALPDDVDLVVLLNNHGVTQTEELVEELLEKKLRVDMAVVSNSNTLTKRPKWVKGVPIVEPLSRGKHFGRADVFLQGDDHTAPVFVNERANTFELLDEYRRAWRAYLGASYALANQREKIAKLRLEIAQQKSSSAVEPQAPSKEKEGEGAEPSAGQGASSDAQHKALEKLLEREVQLGERVSLTSKEAARLAGLLDAPQAARSSDGSEADDWFEVRVVPVLLEIPQHAPVRRALDKFAKK